MVSEQISQELAVIRRSAASLDMHRITEEDAGSGATTVPQFNFIL